MVQMDKFTTARNFELAKRAKKNAEHLAKLVAHKKEWEDSVAKARAEKEAERERIFREGGGDDDDEEEEEEEDEEPEYDRLSCWWLLHESHLFTFSGMKNQTGQNRKRKRSLRLSQMRKSVLRARSLKHTNLLQRMQTLCWNS